ncbi:hypothetical protein EG028_22465 [Chitinophaga barathri]|uniref:Uncharacterized protein n=1 Tax=Chitinophaga barathri TaxID=1647451 RepID=A0A3N4MB11_9BACT|nr:hypothetical protein EG028_22465 [Chitinophaga barathri]
MRRFFFPPFSAGWRILRFFVMLAGMFQLFTGIPIRYMFVLRRVYRRLFFIFFPFGDISYII